MARRKHKELELAVDLEAEVLFDQGPAKRSRVKRIDGKGLKLPRGMRHWFVARTIGGDVDVLLATSRVLRDLKGNDGITQPAYGLIALDEESPLLRIVVTLVHELLHNLFSAPGDDDLNARILGCKPKDVGAREEEIVTHLAPRLADCLIRSGLLRLPPIPRRRRSSK